MSEFLGDASLPSTEGPDAAEQTRRRHVVIDARTEDIEARKFVRSIKSRSAIRQEEEVVAPFFPAALSRRNEPLQFYFGNHAHDSLSFHCKLRPDNEKEVRDTIHRYESIPKLEKVLRQWYADYACFLEQQPMEEQTQQTVMAARAKLSKFEIFQRSGRQIHSLDTNDDNLDIRNDNVRVDHSCNVMVLDAPSWSDAATQLCHGFPSALIKAHQRGYTKGNITCTSKSTKQFIRAFAYKDIFSLCPREQLEKTGLTETEALYCRSIAIERKRSDKSTRLVEAIFR
eukprot:Seg2087.7 transcript_id=Seg2087.7/GoldUCD/mRNA.D3Y31 product="hypothetical protein" protein_id=Seg2087.7/GoldUCD/D3Y31